MLHKLRPLLLPIILIQLFTIYKLIINQNPTNILGQTSFNPISRNSINFPTDSELEYFYEPQPNTLDTGNTWVPYQQGITYTINEDALNERYKYSPTKPNSTYRIVTLGDSYTFGLYVPTPDNWTEQLEDLLNSAQPCSNNFTHYEVINLGMQGYDIQYSLERFRIRGAKYQPDLVIWFIKEGSFTKTQVNELMIPIERQVAEEMEKSGELAHAQAQNYNYPSWEKALEIFNQQYSADYLLDLQGEYIQQLISLHTGKTLLITLPTESYNYRNLLIELAASNPNTQFFNQLPDIQGSDKLHFPNDDHPNTQGHHAIASSVYHYLANSDIICRQSFFTKLFSNTK